MYLKTILMSAIMLLAVPAMANFEELNGPAAVVANKIKSIGEQQKNGITWSVIGRPRTKQAALNASHGVLISDAAFVGASVIGYDFDNPPEGGWTEEHQRSSFGLDIYVTSSNEEARRLYKSILKATKGKQNEMTQLALGAGFLLHGNAVIYYFYPGAMSPQYQAKALESIQNIKEGLEVK